MGIFDYKTYSTKSNFDDIKKLEKAEEILPGLLKVTREAGSTIYVAKMLIPIGDKKTIIISDQTKEQLGTAMENLEVPLELEDLFTIPELDIASLDFGNLSENFQKATDEIKTKFQDLFKK